MVEPSACLVDPTDILAQLFFAVGTRDQVVVSSPSGEFTGVIVSSDGDGIALVPTRAPPSLVPGAPLCLEHAGLDDTYHFYSEVVACDAGEVRVRVPEVIERTEQRACERIVLPPESRVRFRPADHVDDIGFRVHDLSTAGLAFEPVGAVPWALGDVIPGELVLPDDTTIPMRVEVRHLQARRDARLAGVRIDAISLAGRGRIARLLVDARWA